jgi:hypothetical protein
MPDFPGRSAAKRRRVAEMVFQNTHDDSVDFPFETDDPETGIAAARGLIVGLALSQVFWIAVAWLIFH